MKKFCRATLFFSVLFYSHYPHPVAAVTIGASTDLKEDVHLEDCLPDSVGSSVFSTLPHGNFFGFNLFLGFSVGIHDGNSTHHLPKK